jgi:DNA-binding NtrC family response regulator
MTGPARILVIDDDASVRRVIAAALEDEGYVVDPAENGKQAIEMTHAKVYHLALIDVRLPDIEGTKLLSELKETTPKMVKIIVTGYPSMQNAIEAVKKGADDFVVKPFKMEELLNAIKRRLKTQQEEREYSEAKVKEYIETRIDERDHDWMKARSGEGTRQTPGPKTRSRGRRHRSAP